MKSGEVPTQRNRAKATQTRKNESLRISLFEDNRPSRLKGTDLPKSQRGEETITVSTGMLGYRTVPVERNKGIPFLTEATLSGVRMTGTNTTDYLAR